MTCGGSLQVKEVPQLDDRRLHWKAGIGGKEKERDA